MNTNIIFGGTIIFMAIVVAIIVLIVKLTSCEWRKHYRISLSDDSRYCPVCGRYEVFGIVNACDKAWLLFETPPADKLLDGIKRSLEKGGAIDWNVDGESYIFSSLGMREKSGCRFLEEQEVLGLIGRKARKVIFLPHGR